MQKLLSPILGAVIPALCVLPAATSAQDAAVSWTVDTSGKGPDVSPEMHGIFFEDINYAGDGGLYAELVENRSFEHRDNMHAWTEIKRGNAAGSVALAEKDAVHANNPRFIRLEIESAGDGFGVSNLGYGGIPVAEGKQYRFSAHVRGSNGYRGGLKVRIESTDGKVLAEGKIDKVAASWQRPELMLTSKGTDPAARLVVLADAAGQVDLDVISLFPKDTWNGRENGLRADLVKLLADMKPGFMRFPGGCIIEGFDLGNAYRWKDTVGPIWERKQNWNRWIQENPNRPDHHYHQTYGLGFFEFFQLCEDIGAAPVPVINCGMACQFQSKQLVPLDELDPWVQDALDLVEFANGPVTSKWGKLRADMGHPKPFGMKYLGVGNEQWGPEYFKRYEVFYKALKAAHPGITLITTSGPGVDDGNWRFAWDKFGKGTPAEIVDEHYYRSPEWFLEHAARYDSYDRSGPKVFAGEFAAHRKDRKNALNAAVCEAAFMTGLLRNADLVTMSCYAPLFAREGFVQWTPDLIWFNATNAMPTPSYHIQAMYGNNRPDRVLPSKFENNDIGAGTQGRIGVGTWKTQAEFKDVVVRSKGKVLFQSGNDMSGWDPKTGNWSASGGVIKQDALQEGAVVLAGDPSWRDYTLSLKARKTGGSEGFLILFSSANEKDRSWWNVGGWGNTGHALEVQGREYPRVPGSIETGRWYDIRIELSGNEVACYLDNKLVHKIERHAQPKIYAVAGVDRKAGELILHASNPSGEPREVQINIPGWKSGKSAHGQVLTSANPNDVNSIAEPGRVAPAEVSVPVAAGRIRHTLPAWSHTVLRLPR